MHKAGICPHNLDVELDFQLIQPFISVRDRPQYPSHSNQPMTGGVAAACDPHCSSLKL